MDKSGNKIARALLVLVIVVLGGQQALQGAWLTAVVLAFSIVLLPFRLPSNMSWRIVILMLIFLICVSRIGHRYNFGFIENGALFMGIVCVATTPLLLLSENGINRFRLVFVTLASIVCFFDSTILVRWCDLLKGKSKVSVGYAALGVWAGTSEKRVLDIESQYSYSELVRLIKGEKIELITPESLDDLDVLWLVTPTTPFTVKECDALRSWVMRGGKLFVIADHTDLFGHAVTLEPLLSRFGVSIGRDAIIGINKSQVDYYSKSGRLIGLTGCSFHGRGNPLFWSWGASESADYGGRSFFGDLEMNDGDVLGVHFLGLRTPFGFGEVTTFGDSTFFANFALARYSSQKALELLYSRDAALPILDLASSSLLLWVVLSLRYGRLVRLTAALSWVVYMISLFSERGDLDISWPENSIQIYGDPMLTDLESSAYSAAVASWFGVVPRIPVWKSAEFGGGYLGLGERIIKPSAHPVRFKSIEEILSAKLDDDFEGLINRVVGACWDSRHHGEIWFDDGVGLVRSEVFNGFWNPNRNISLNVRYREILEVKSINGNILNSVVRTSIVWLDDKGWALLGGGLIGRWLDDKSAFLARKSWQFGDYAAPDAVIEVERSKYTP